MCEFTEDCTLVTDPVAKALSENPREDSAELLVLCPIRYHLLAAVYDLPGRGLTLCRPHMKARLGSLFQVQPDDDPDMIVHWHPDLTPMADFPDDESCWGRCRCGTWHYKPIRAIEAIADIRSGRREPRDAGGGLVRVRNDATGSVSKLGREYVERFLLPKGGHTIVGNAPGSPRRRRPHILSDYVGAHVDRDTRHARNVEH